MDTIGAGHLGIGATGNEICQHSFQYTYTTPIGTDLGQRDSPTQFQPATH